MNDDSEKALNKGSSQTMQVTKNKIAGDFLKKVRSELWNIGDFHVSGEIKKKSDYCILTNEGEIKDDSVKYDTHLEVCVKDADTETFVPGLDIEVVITQNGERIKGPIDLQALYRPNEAVYTESIDIEEGVYDIQLNISSGESDEEIMVCFEKISCMT